MKTKKMIQMNVNEFMFTLNDELIKNSFIGVEIYKEYIKHEKSYSFTVSAGKRGKKYTLSFSVNENYLDYNTIEMIIDWFLKKEIEVIK